MASLHQRSFQISDFRLGSKQSGARIWTQNHPQQQQWAHSRRFESEIIWLKGLGVRQETWCFDISLSPEKQNRTEKSKKENGKPTRAQKRKGIEPHQKP